MRAVSSNETSSSGQAYQLPDNQLNCTRFTNMHERMDAGDWVNVKGISAMLYGLAPEALASCSASSLGDPAQRCIYPDTLNGTWNVSLTYDSDTLITLPHFLEVR